LVLLIGKKALHLGPCAEGLEIMWRTGGVFMSSEQIGNLCGRCRA